MRYIRAVTASEALLNYEDERTKHTILTIIVWVVVIDPKFETIVVFFL